MQHAKFNILVDSAWGSSAKGAASTRLCDIYKVQNASSNNYPNAGHTAIVNNEKFISKTLPTPAILKSTLSQPITCWMGPGSGFTLKQLEKEQEQTKMILGEDLFIHDRAVIVEDRHIDMEKNDTKFSTLHLSSTMSGSGAAACEKAMRTKDIKLARDFPQLKTVNPWDFVNKVYSKLDAGETFLHEVSQGWALSINHGTHYPYCTSRDCSPQQACSDFSITKKYIGDIYLNVRSFPIRVGNNFNASGQQVGYSGDCMPDQEELTWEQIGKDAEMPEEEIASLGKREFTTVTLKKRRAFTQSWDLLKMSAKMCGATKLILNFPQYIHWSAYKLKGDILTFLNLHNKVKSYIARMEKETNLPVVMIGTGPDHDDYILPYKDFTKK